MHNNQRGVPDAMPTRHHSFRPSCSARSCPAQCPDGARSEGILADYDAKLLFACFVQVYPMAPSRRRHTWCTRRSRNIPDQLLASHHLTRLPGPFGDMSSPSSLRSHSTLQRFCSRPHIGSTRRACRWTRTTCRQSTYYIGYRIGTILDRTHDY